MHTESPGRRSLAAPLTAVGLLALPLLYAGGHVALLSPSDRLLRDEHGICDADRVPAYRVGDEWAARLYRPAHWIDRRVRPGYWQPDREPVIP